MTCGRRLYRCAVRWPHSHFWVVSLTHVCGSCQADIVWLTLKCARAHRLASAGPLLSASSSIRSTHLSLSPPQHPPLIPQPHWASFQRCSQTSGSNSSTATTRQPTSSSNNAQLLEATSAPSKLGSLELHSSNVPWRQASPSSSSSSPWASRSPPTPLARPPVVRILSLTPHHQLDPLVLVVALAIKAA